MNDTEQTNPHELATFTAEIVGAYVAHHTLASSDLPALIMTIGKELAELGQAPAETVPEEEKLVPAVPIKRSVTPDYLICLEDGKKMTMLKRHLRTRYGMTPEEYRKRWGLKDDYPMVAPAYSEERSALAKKIGLGRPKTSAKSGRTSKPRKKATKKS